MPALPKPLRSEVDQELCFRSHLEFEAVDGGSTISLNSLQFSDYNGFLLTTDSDEGIVAACANFDGDSLESSLGFYSNNGGCS